MRAYHYASYETKALKRPEELDAVVDAARSDAL
jgi:hypothetical protein